MKGQFKLNKILIAATALLGISSNLVIASEIDFSGYGSIRAGIAIDENSAAPSFGYDDKLDFKNESTFALQTKAQLNDKWSATLVLHASGKNDFDLKARWAYLNYQISPETVITLGRFALPYFRHSDTQDIGYSHAFTRMPKSIYAGQEFDVIEGVRVTHNTFVGDGDLVVKGSYGNFDGQANTALGSVDTEVNNIVQLSAEYTYEWLSVYVGVLSSDVLLDINDPIDRGLMQSLPGYNVSNGIVYDPDNNSVYDMRNTYVDEDRTTYYSAGATTEYENWVFNVEYAEYDIDDSFFETTKGFYASLSYVMDTMTFSIVHEDASYSFEYEHANSLDPYVNGFVTEISNAFFLGDEYDAQGIHIRYDAFPGVAYKFEFTKTNHDLTGDDNKIVVLGVDFVF